MTNMQRAVAVRAFYNSALYVIGASIATCDASAKLREAVVNGDAVDLLNKTFDRLPSMFERFLKRLDNEEAASALSQLEYMISSLRDILREITAYKDMLRSHSNDALIVKQDLASLLILESLAKQQLVELNKELIVFEDEA